MKTGIVKWFSNAKGYGFISQNENGNDVFAHFSAIAMEGYRTLRRGQHVTFEVNDGPKGLLASNILPISEEEHSVPEQLRSDAILSQMASR